MDSLRKIGEARRKAEEEIQTIIKNLAKETGCRVLSIDFAPVELTSRPEGKCFTLSYLHYAVTIKLSNTELGTL